MCDKMKSDMDCGTESKSYPTVTDAWIDNTLSRPDAYVFCFYNYEVYFLVDRHKLFHLNIVFLLNFKCYISWN